MFEKVTRCFGKMKYKAIQNSPELYLVAGTVLLGVGIVTACRATLKADEILDDLKEELDKIEETKEASDKIAEETEGRVERYTETDRNEDIKNSKIQHSVQIAREFVVPALCIAGGLGCMYRGHFVLKDRYLGMTAAYESVRMLFRKYRDRVIADQGLEADQRYLYGTKNTSIVDMNPDGTVSNVQKADDPDVKAMPGVMLFDSYSKKFVKDRNANAMTVSTVESWANRLLHRRGYVFLSEILEELDMPAVPHGNCFGWVSGGDGDNRIDLRAVICPGTTVYEVEIDPNFDGDISKIYPKYDISH